jgi:hypothetical protein
MDTQPHRRPGKLTVVPNTYAPCHVGEQLTAFGASRFPDARDVVDRRDRSRYRPITRSPE